MDKLPSSKWYDGIQDGDQDAMLNVISRPIWKDVSICLDGEPLQKADKTFS
jgi:hypothetical protein